MKRICSVTECGRAASSKSFCDAHYRQWRKYGAASGPLAHRGQRNDSYRAIHSKLHRERGSAKSHPCVDCGGRASEWSYDGNASDERSDASNGLLYSMNPDYYSARCVKCHRTHDDHGAATRGNRNGRARLTETDVLAIRASEETAVKLAKDYSVSEGTISAIRTGRNWRYL